MSYELTDVPVSSASSRRAIDVSVVVRSRRLLIAGLTALTAGLTAVIVALAYPPIWSAVDDTGILREANEHGLAALFWESSTYLQLIQRAVSLIEGPDPLMIGALGSYLAVAAVAFFLAWRVHPVTILALILAPAFSVYGTLSNIQWVLAVYLVGMLVATPPTSSLGRMGDAIGLFLCGLTGPFSVVLLPLYAVRAINPVWRWHLIVLASAAALQVAFLLLTHRPPGPTQDILGAMVVRDGVPVVAIVLAGWWFSIWRTLGALYVAILIPLFGVLKTMHTTSELFAGEGQRYFYIPWVIAIAMVLIVLSSRLRDPWSLRLLRPRGSLPSDSATATTS